MSFLWTAPVTLPMMFAVVYLSAKVGQVSGKGLFRVIKDAYPRYILFRTLIAAVIGNVIEAGADLGGMAAALNLIVPIPIPRLVLIIAVVILAVQFLGSYLTIRNIFRWLTLILLAYVASALLAKPNPGEVLRGTVLPQIRFDREFLTTIVATIGTTLSAYIYSWQSNQEIEEKIEASQTLCASAKAPAGSR